MPLKMSASFNKDPQSEAQPSPEQVRETAEAIKDGWKRITPHVIESLPVRAMGDLSDRYDNGDSVVAEIGLGKSRLTVFEDGDGDLYGMRAVKDSQKTPDGKDYYRLDASTAFNITDQAVTIGCASKAFSDDKDISRNHFKIGLNGDKLEITDVGSSDGTMLRSVHENAEVKGLDREARRRLLFAPPKTEKDLIEANEFDFSGLLSDEDNTEQGAQYLAQRAEEEAKDRPFEVTADTLEHAGRMVEEAVKDKEINTIFQKYNLHGNPTLMVEAVRSNPSLRWELANSILNKIDSIAGVLPDRVRDNTWKSFSQKGQEELRTKLSKVKSREYVAMMCLAMLDGTYDPSSEVSDPMDLDKGKSGIGQHRRAAYQTLLTPGQYR